MAIRMLGQLELETTETLINLLKKLPLTKDVSTYAVNRKRVWINGLGEPSLSNPPRLFRSLKCPTIHEIISKLGIKYDFCLAHYSGEEAIGITPHRDAPYANATAYGINLGPCQFMHNGSIHQLTGGEIYTFNCKKLHSAKPAPHRWGLNLWTAQEHWIAIAKRR